jgi:hypothetical protein
MYSSEDYDPDNRLDVRAGPKPAGMFSEEYLYHVRKHSEEWYKRSMHSQILGMVTTRTFMMMEDDYLPPPDAVTRLMGLLTGRPRCAVASACQTYRAPKCERMGIAPADVIVWDEGMIIYKRSFSPKTEGVREAQGTSFSCFAAKTEPYRAAFGEAMATGLLMTYIGHDHVITNVITKLGWKVLVDFGVWGDHMQLEDRKIRMFNRSNALRDSYFWNKAEGRYDWNLEE